jgi:S1-C subfamily serine protease
MQAKRRLSEQGMSAFGRGRVRTGQFASILTCVIALIIFGGSASQAQDAVPAEIMARTGFIKWGNEAGTAFTIDYQDKLYLITARHVVAGIPDTNAVLQVRDGDKWTEYKTTKTIYPESSDVDIAIFATDEKPPQHFAIEPMSGASGPTFGQQLWFIGYPYGLGSNIQGHILPFLKRGSMSAVDSTNKSAIIFYIDGFNNPGFSGGPIIFWDFSSHKYEILGVVQGYKEDTAKTLVNGRQVDTQYLVNSGILVAYSIGHAMDAIKAYAQSKQ